MAWILVHSGFRPSVWSRSVVRAAVLKADLKKRSWKDKREWVQAACPQLPQPEELYSAHWWRVEVVMDGEVEGGVWRVVWWLDGSARSQFLYLPRHPLAYP